MTRVRGLGITGLAWIIKKDRVGGSVFEKLGRKGTEALTSYNIVVA